MERRLVACGAVVDGHLLYPTHPGDGERHRRFLGGFGRKERQRGKRVVDKKGVPDDEQPREDEDRGEQARQHPGRAPRRPVLLHRALNLPSPTPLSYLTTRAYSTKATFRLQNGTLLVTAAPLPRKRGRAFAAIICRMRVGVPREITEGENRVGLVPETIQKLVKEGFEVLVETGAGRDYNLEENYEEAGARIASDAGVVYGEADIVVKVAKPTEAEVVQMHEGQVLVCFLNGPQEPELVGKLADAGVTVFSNEAIPRTSVAQSMDALSSMGSIAGYKCALIAANTLGKYVPMLSTAAGTTKAANVMIFGVAVAGLQAIAIMNRLGASVFAYDIRPETKEQAQSLGATFIDSEDEKIGRASCRERV